jgi:transposase
MASFAGAFSDLPSPPYPQPEDYDALVEAMLQQLYRLNPEWVERKQRLQQVCAPPRDPDIVCLHSHLAV